ncbi:SDR family oxidoreductase [Magnetospira thiophila]
MRLDMTDRIALVTGAGSGIGRALALALAAAGMTVILVGRRTDALEETRALSQHALRMWHIPTDITDPTARRQLVERVKARHGRLDLLINNAGMVTVGLLATTTDAQLQRMIDLNVIAPLALTRDFLPLLKKGQAARVVMIGSMFGDIGFPLFAAYSATKFAVRGLAEALRRELHPLGIGVTYAAPRATRTPAADGFSNLIEPLSMTLDAPEDVARHILDAIRRQKRSVYPLGPERLFVLIQKLFPALVDRSVVRQTEALTRDKTTEANATTRQSELVPENRTVS